MSLPKTPSDAPMATNANTRLCSWGHGSCADRDLTGIRAILTGLRARKRYLNFAGTKDVIYIYSGTQVVAEYEITTPTGSSTTTVLTEYIYAGSQKLASITGGTVKYHLQDHLSIRVTTDSSGGNAIEQAQYPFGEDWYAGSGASKFKFTTYERDTAQSDYAVFRNYQFLNGRFNRPDPIGGSHISPQTLNRYTYSRNDPINLVDPVGLEEGGYSACIWFLYANGRGEILGSCNNGGPDDLMLTILDLIDREGGGDLRKLRKQAVADCVKEMFNVDLVDFTESSKGKGGVFIGDGTDMIRADGNDARITVRNDVTRFTRAELARLYGKGKEVDGLTLDGVFWLGLQPIRSTPYTNYAGSGQSLAAISTNQIHELAHSLAMITGVKTPPDTEGSDIGDKLVDCVLQHMLAALKRSGNK